MAHKIELYDFTRYAGCHFFICTSETNKTKFQVKGWIEDGELPRDMTLYATRNGRTKRMNNLQYGGMFETMLDAIADETRGLRNYNHEDAVGCDRYHAEREG